MTPTRYYLVALISSIVALPFTASAEEPIDSQRNAGDIERIVTTTSRLPSTEQERNLMLAVLDSEQLTLTGHQHIQQALLSVSGVNLHRGNGQEYLPALRSQVLSGAGACGGLLTAEDGIPLRAAGFCNINEMFEAHSEMAQRIEIIKGPGSVLFGSNALHGVINIITPDTTDGQQMLGVEAGSYDYARLKLRTGSQWKESGAGINLSLTKDGGYREQEDFEQQKVNLRYRTELAQWQIESGLSYSHLDQQTAGFITGFESYKDKSIAKQNDNPEAFRKAESVRFWTKLRTSLDNGSEILLTPYLRDQEMDFLMHFLPGDPLEHNSQYGAGIQSLWQLSLDQNWQWRMGLDAEYTKGSLRQSQDTITVGSAFLVETIPTGLHYDYSVTATQLSPFAQVQWQNGNWLASAGLRYESMEYDYQNHMLTGRTRDDGSACGFGGCRYARPADSIDRFSNFSPKLALRYNLNLDTSFFANIAHGFRAPQATELYRLQRDQQIADLDSVVATNTELGVTGSLHSLAYSVAIYQMDKDNFIFRDSDFFNVNDGQSRHQGLEIDLSYMLSTDWQVDLAYTYAKHQYRHQQVLNEVNIQGNDIDSAPRNVGKMQITWTPTANAHIQLEWQHMGSYFTDPENLHRYDGHEILNLYSRFNVSEGVWLNLKITNLADTQYAERADFTGFSGDRYFPGRPRSVFVGIEFKG